MHAAQRWTLCKKRKRPQVLRTFCCLLLWYFLCQSTELSHAANPTITLQEPINENIFFLLSFQFVVFDVYYPNSFERMPATTIAVVPVTSVTQQKVIIFILLSISLLIIVVLVVYYPNSFERIPPTTIIDVPVTSVTQQNVIIFFPSFRFGLSVSKCISFRISRVRF